MSNWKSGVVESSGARLRYHRTGGSLPTVILAHGLTDNGLCWTRVAQDLESDHDVVMYDARGHGRSSASSPDDPPLTPALDLVALSRALELERPALIGHSMGAVTVALAATIESTLFQAAVLVDPPLRPDLGEDLIDVVRPENREWWDTWRQTVIHERTLPQSELAARCRQRSPNWAAIEVECWAVAHREVDPVVFDARYVMHGPWQRRASSIVCPVLLIAGDPEPGSLVDPAAAEALVRNWTQGRLVRIAGAGHSVHRDRYDGFMEEVRAFLDRTRPAPQDTARTQGTP